MEENKGLFTGNEPVDLLGEESYVQNQFIYATQGQRFLNWLIDNLLMRFGFAYLSGLALGTLISIASPNFFNEMGASETTITLLFLGVFVAYFNYIVYYTLCEKLFRGYTLGKLITGTRAIRQDGGELTFRNAFLRSLSRCVPFEVFSGFSMLTWHDNWTDTMVVKAR